MSTWLPRPCGKCGEQVTTDDAWVVGHIKSRLAYPLLTMELSNWQPEHRKCSDGSSHEASREKGRVDAFRALGLDPDFSGGTDHRTDPALLSSLPEEVDGPVQQALPGIVVTTPEPAGDALHIREDLRWDPDRLAAYPWLTDLVRNIPDDAMPPLWMSPPAADATGSHGEAAIWWIESSQGLTLRWWQRLAITRQLEHRADGTLCCETYIESAPRRAGKSVRMRGVGLWRLADPLDMFGETQLVMHTGNDLATCREIQRGAWTWAEANSWTVTRANGKEAVETPDGDRWLTRSQDAVYGYDVCLAMVDESWDVKPETVADGLEPAMLERIMPQLMLTSTAHPRTTSLMPTYLRAALTHDDPTVIILVWGVDPARLAGLTPRERADLLADPTLWRAASPHWTAARRDFIASKWERARAQKPTPDNPDPIRTFEKQYLNVWTLDLDTSLPGEPITTATSWGHLATDVPDEKPASAAIESWFEDGVSLALGRVAGTRVVVSVSDHATVASAVAAMRAAGFRHRVTVGASLLNDPALAGVAKTSGEKPVSAAVGQMSAYLREDVVRHDTGTHLTEQLLDIRITRGANGPVMKSTGRADAVKAAVWAISAARPAARRERRRMVTAGG